ncbi:MAG: hypothetical protein H0X62_13380, partial [Bacteroidetes bacterium]|nr:hypothetical protein [Bacteroidota bacterium]
INILEEEKQIGIFLKIIEHDLSVRDTEHLAKGEKAPQITLVEEPKENPSKSSKPSSTEYATLSFEQKKAVSDLNKILNSKVGLKLDNNGKGKIVIEFDSEDQLQSIFDILDI